MILLQSRYLVDEPSITVIGKPSAALAEKLAQESKERLAGTKEKLGEAGLKKKGEELDVAQEENDRPIPAEMITDFPISDVSHIGHCEDYEPADIGMQSYRLRRSIGFQSRGKSVLYRIQVDIAYTPPYPCSAVNPVASFGNASPKVQARVDLDGNELPYSVHYAHASVSIEPSIGHNTCTDLSQT